MSRKLETVHGIISRFGIGIFDEAWFEHRFALFRALTLPSLLSQTSRDYVWLICVDRDMPELPALRLRELLQGVDNAVTLRMTGFDIRACVKYLRRQCRAREATHVATTRLDDDDAIHCGFVARVHDLCQRMNESGKLSEGAVLSFQCGYQLNLVDGTVCRSEKKNPSPGMTLVAAKALEASVYSANHTLIDQYAAKQGFDYVPVLHGEPMWIYTRHRQTDSKSPQSEAKPQVWSLHDVGAERALASFATDLDACRLYHREQSKYAFFQSQRLVGRQSDVAARIRALRTRSQGDESAAKDLEVLERAYRAAGSDLFGSAHSEVTILHGIVTRFGFEPWNASDVELNLRALKKLAVAGLDSQTSKDFAWYLCADGTLPSWALEELRRLQAHRPYLTLLESSQFKPRECVSIIRGRLDRGRPHWVITTRLDPVDGLSSRFVEQVRLRTRRALAQSPHHNGYVVQAPEGLVYLMETGTIYEVRHGVGFPTAQTVVVPYESKTNCFSYPPQNVSRFIEKRGFARLSIGGTQWIALAHRRRQVLRALDGGSMRATKCNVIERDGFGFAVGASASAELSEKDSRRLHKWWTRPNGGYERLWRLKVDSRRALAKLVK